MTDPDKITDAYGRSIYYQVGDAKTTSKILALELAGGDIHRVSFHWNEKDLDQVDWAQPPAESFNSLMDRTVKEIRSKHQQVNLFYSGGYDSHTIYEAFRRNGLKIDKFIIWRREWYHGLSDAEYQSALDVARVIKQHVWPDLEIVTLAWRIQDNHRWYREMGNDWIYHNGSQLKFAKHGRDLIYRYNSLVQKEVLDRSDSVTLMGYEKPKLDLYDGRWYVSHLDNQIWLDMHDPCLHVFYIPEIYHQQAWQIAQWMESLPGFNTEMLHKIQSNSLGPDMYRAYNLAMGRTPVLHELNSGGHGKVMWQGKDPRQVEESRGFREESRVHDQDVFGIYEKGLSYVEKKFGHVMNGGNLQVLFSKKYFVKEFEPSL